MTATRGSRQEKVNKSMPALSKAKLGDVIAELTAQVNVLTAAHNVLVAKLNLDAGVTDTNYAAVAATPIVSMEAR
jgi:hypothetical protein